MTYTELVERLERLQGLHNKIWGEILLDRDAKRVAEDAITFVDEWLPKARKEEICYSNLRMIYTKGNLYWKTLKLIQKHG